EAQLARLQHLRTIARFVDWRVLVLLADGDQQAANDWSLSLLDLSELCQEEPTIVSYLVTVAMRNMALNNLHQSLIVGPVDAATYAKVDKELERLERDVHLEEVFRKERALTISACIEQGWERAPPVVGNLLGWPVKRHFLGSIELYDTIIPLADEPYHEVEKEFQAGGTLAVPTGKGVLADLLLPSVVATIKASNRDLALIRSLRVLNSLQQADDDAQGLDNADVPAAWTIDPFTGRSLVVKKSDSGVSVYSVGEDKTDDGGMFKEGKDCGFGPAKRSHATGAE
ncbi:MAG: hypothetical protein KDA87_27120, partial [Planctomycetales bacterium]|nr:hypothetical protein [Planctomycetales bacterium]